MRVELYDAIELATDFYPAAHWNATKVGILHRDVSGGNILILPVRRTPKAGRPEPEIIVWIGMLADWEMSKPLSSVVAFLKPRQPERTVCDSQQCFAHTLIAVTGNLAVHVGGLTFK